MAVLLQTKHYSSKSNLVIISSFVLRDNESKLYLTTHQEERSKKKVLTTTKAPEDLLSSPVLLPSAQLAKTPLILLRYSLSTKCPKALLPGWSCSTILSIRTAVRFRLLVFMSLISEADMEFPKSSRRRSKA